MTLSCFPLLAGCTMNARSSLLLTWTILRAFIFREHLEKSSMFSLRQRAGFLTSCYKMVGSATSVFFLVTPPTVYVSTHRSPPAHHHIRTRKAREADAPAASWAELKVLYS